VLSWRTLRIAIASSYSAFKSASRVVCTCRASQRGFDEALALECTPVASRLSFALPLRQVENFLSSARCFLWLFLSFWHLKHLWFAAWSHLAISGCQWLVASSLLTSISTALLSPPDPSLVSYPPHLSTNLIFLRIQHSCLWVSFSA